MVKGITALLNKQKKETFDEVLKIKPLKSISKVTCFKLYHLDLKKKKKKEQSQTEKS